MTDKLCEATTCPGPHYLHHYACTNKATRVVTHGGHERHVCGIHANLFNRPGHAASYASSWGWKP